MKKPKVRWYDRFRPQDKRLKQPNPIINRENPKNHWYDRFRPQDMEGTQPIPPVQDQPTQATPHQVHLSSNGDAAEHQGRAVEVPWKSIIAVFLAFLIGIGMASCGSSDPKESSAYKDLDAKYSKTSRELITTREELDQTKDDLKTAKKKADKWDKEQKEKKAAAEKAAQEKAAQEKAAQEQAAQEQAAQQAQLAAQQAQQQAQQQAERTRQQAAQQQAPPVSGIPYGGPTVHRGAFCTPAGATGQSDRDNNILTCRPARDGRLRWMN